MTPEQLVRLISGGDITPTLTQVIAHQRSGTPSAITTQQVRDGIAELERAIAKAKQLLGTVDQVPTPRKVAVSVPKPRPLINLYHHVW